MRITDWSSDVCSSDRDHGLARRMAYADPARFGAIIDAITDLTVEYLAGQVEAGVDAVQLFDSWAGSLSPAQFKQWVITPTRSIVDQLRVRCTGIPIIGFPTGDRKGVVSGKSGSVRGDLSGARII